MILKLQMIKGRLAGGNLGMKISWVVACGTGVVLWFVGNI